MDMLLCRKKLRGFLAPPLRIRPISGLYLPHIGAETLPALSPYSRPDAFAKLDGRTREARMMREVRADLIAHVGGTPSATQRVLIDRAARLTLQVAMLDTKQTNGAALTEHDARTYLAWTNTLTRLMRQLGMKAAADHGPTLRQYLDGPAAA